MKKSSIHIDVVLDDDKMPEQISWNASDSTATEPKNARAMMLAFWDQQDSSALRIDLWTKDMMVDDMADFFYQTLLTMADTYHRATRQEDLSNDLKTFARNFYQKFRQQQIRESKS